VSPRRRRRASSRSASRPPAVAPPPDLPSAERLLLDVARVLTARAGTLASVADLHALIEAAFDAYGANTPLAAALRRDWLRGRDDKTARLALGWAREQVRLALVDGLARGRHAGLVHASGDLDTLAWLWLAACEALAHDVPGAAPDRVSALATFLTTAGR
jgi:hypothetical protein